MPQTGPKTEKGKRKSALNALKHGSYARSVEALAILNEVCPVKLDDVLNEMEALYQPINSLERVLVKRIALCLWRLARVETMEKKAFIRNPYESRPSESLDKIVKYERMVDTNLHKAISALERQRTIANNHSKQTEAIIQVTQSAAEDPALSKPSAIEQTRGESAPVLTLVPES